MGIIDRFKNAWNAFIGLDPPYPNSGYIGNYSQRYFGLGDGSSFRPDRLTLKRGSERSIAGAVFNKIAVHCSMVEIKHVRLDDQGRYLEDMKSYLNDCLTLQANRDQTAKDLIRDIVLSMFDEGYVAVVPIDTTENPKNTDSYDIGSLRTGKIINWFPSSVEVEVYNERTGHKVPIIMDKKDVAIIENPFASIMNEPNSILQRLIHKLSLLDIVDDQNSSGKLDLIIQLPYIVKTEARKKYANDRRTEIENQLKDSKYGIAYTDGTEHITQLNRPVENNLLKQIEYLYNSFLSQMGVDVTVLNGTADEKTMTNYINTIIVPIESAICDAFKVKFLSRTARSQRQSIVYFNNPFKFITVSQVADIADKLTRNEIMSSNEMRQVVGLKPVQDPKADELRNKNLPAVDTEQSVDPNQVTEQPRITGNTKLSELK